MFVRHFGKRLMVWFLRAMRWHARLLAKLLVLAGVVAALIWAGATFWLFPSVDNYRQDVSQLAGELSGLHVSIGHIQAGWEDFDPAFRLSDVTLYDQQGQPALHLDRVRANLSWLSLLVFEVRFSRIVLDTPELVLKRDRQGLIHLAGLTLNGPGEGRFGNWILRQHRIDIDQGRIVWIDARPGVPALQIEQVRLRINNLFRVHRIELSGTPPTHLASAVSLNGTLRGSNLNQLQDWSGDLKLDLAYADVAAWRPWLPLPKQLLQGRGGVSTWFAFRQQQLEQGVLQLNVSDALLQFQPSLPVLRVSRLQGRATLGTRDGENSLLLQDVVLSLGEGQRLQQGRLLLERQLDAAGQLAALELSADELKLHDWLKLAPYLPLPDSVAGQLHGLQARGLLRQFKLSWLKPSQPGQSFEISSSFNNLSLLPPKPGSGVDNLSGNLVLGSKGGALNLDCQSCSLILPELFVDDLQFARLQGKARWQRAATGWKVDISQLRMSNADVSGVLSGSYTSAAQGAGVADLRAELLNGRADAVWRYIPLTVGDATRSWLRSSLKAGTASRAVMVLQGALDDFPWDKKPTGRFRVDVDAHDVDLDYADDWPMIARIGASLVFEGDQLLIHAKQGNLMGVRLGRVQAQIPSLDRGDRLLIDGETQGPLINYLRFVDASPVNTALAGFTNGTGGTGDARLRLKLDVPLDDADGTRVNGQLMFAGNQLYLGRGIPSLEQVHGSVHFTERSLRVPAVTARGLGGKLTLTGDTAADGSIQLQAAGNATVAGLSQAYPDPVWRYARGDVRYSLGINARKGNADWWLESNLQGAQLDLPPPLRKQAGDSRPLRIQMRAVNDEQSRWQIRYDRALLADLLYQQRRLLRGALTLNPAAEAGGRSGAVISQLPGKAGLALSGNLPYVGVDAWTPLLGMLGSAGGGSVNVNDFRIGQLDLYGKRLNDLRLWAGSDGQVWSGAVQSRELNGSFSYSDQGPGRLTARLKRLNLPLQEPPAAESPAVAAERGNPSWPVVDVEIENLQYKERSLGRLELKAAPKGELLQIERFATIASDGRMELDGSWDYRSRVPGSKMNVRLESDDVGKFLGRFGLADTVRRGGAKISGQLAWVGSPYAPDLASLSGSFELEAKSGQFAKVEPGVGRLLGIVSLQALPRRMTLDFRDVFSEGFAFDAIAGRFDVNRGVMHTDNFSIVGPAAVVSMKGDIDLLNQSQLLNVKVVPVIGDGVSIAAGFVVSPVIGLTALVLQKMLKDPLGQLMAYEYRLSGKWQDPKVEKLGSAVLNSGKDAAAEAARNNSPYSN